MKIEMEERGMEVLLALTISGQGGFGGAAVGTGDRARYL
jgi:hypothetical protein